tara:strand:- start:127 stop:612 length:486 start_codon:yes stop_codon:yes gene_type:complete
MNSSSALSTSPPRYSSIGNIGSKKASKEQQVKKESRLEYGAAVPFLENGRPDSEFEHTMSKFLNWCENNKFAVKKLSQGGYYFQKVDYREIRAAFKDYDPSVSTLRADRLVPVPNTKMEIFLEMFFDKLGAEWEMFSTDEVMSFHEGFEYYEQSFIEQLKS